MTLQITVVCKQSAFPLQQTFADTADGHVTRSGLGRIPSIVVTSESSPFLPIGRKGSKAANHSNTRGGLGKELPPPSSLPHQSDSQSEGCSLTQIGSKKSHHRTHWWHRSVGVMWPPWTVWSGRLVSIAAATRGSSFLVFLLLLPQWCQSKNAAFDTCAPLLCPGWRQTGSGPRRIVKWSLCLLILKSLPEYRSLPLAKWFLDSSWPIL